LKPYPFRTFVPLLLRTLSGGKMDPFGPSQFQALWFSHIGHANLPVPSFATIVKGCRGLVEVVVDEGTEPRLRLTHDSVQDFLLREPCDPCLVHWYDILRVEFDIARQR
jgi:hypothetical protein